MTIEYEKGEDGSMVINKEQAKTIEFIYSEFIMGLSPKAIAKKLTELGYETPGGQKKWYEGTVRSILKKLSIFVLLQTHPLTPYISGRG